MTDFRDELAGRLQSAAEEYGVPGASIAILGGGTVSAEAIGLLNVATGIEATPDSLFQIGSITKIYTSTLVMMLVDDGLIGLDDPIIKHLPDFAPRPGGGAERDRPSSPHAQQRHRGDHFVDTGRGDDCIRRYVETLADVAQIHPVGLTMSYSNAGFILLGALIEALTGSTWDAALKSRIIVPLGLTHTATLPEEVILFRSATGHLDLGDGKPFPTPIWGFPRAAGPAGLICASAADLMTFARMHLDLGRTSAGVQLLSGDSVTAMQTPQVELHDRWTMGETWGLGWSLSGSGAGRTLFHDGGTIGQSAFLLLAPEHGLAIALLTNGGNGAGMFEELHRWLFEALNGPVLPLPLTPANSPPAYDAGDYVGTYGRATFRAVVEVGAEGLELVTTILGPLAQLEFEPTKRHQLQAVDPSQRLFVAPGPFPGSVAPVVFFRLADGSEYLHYNLQAAPLTSGRHE